MYRIRRTLVSAMSMVRVAASFTVGPLVQGCGVMLHIAIPVRYVDRPELVRPCDAALITGVPVVPPQLRNRERRAGHRVTHFLRSDGGRKLRLRFTRLHPMPGEQLIFCVVWDECSRMFWATAKTVVDSQGKFEWCHEHEMPGGVRYVNSIGGSDQRSLMLVCGVDDLNWLQECCVVQAARICLSSMPARPVIGGEDLTIIARIGTNAPDHHDADSASSHRVHPC